MNIIQGAAVGHEMCAGDCGRVAGPKGYCRVCTEIRFSVVDTSRMGNGRQEWAVDVLGWMMNIVMVFIGFMVIFSLNHAVFKTLVMALELTNLEICMGIEGYLLSEFFWRRHRVE
jgi:hypothetical protein